MTSRAWKATESASPDALVCTLAFVIDLLEKSTERIAPAVLLDIIAGKVTLVSGHSGVGNSPRTGPAVVRYHDSGARPHHAGGGSGRPPTCAALFRQGATAPID